MTNETRVARKANRRVRREMNMFKLGFYWLCVGGFFGEEGLVEEDADGS